MSNTHEVLVVRIGEIRPHPNADKLELTDINGYQMVVGKGSFKPGDLAVFVQPDSVVPQTEPFKFIWGDHVGVDGKVPERRRRIVPKRLRKEWSEGLLLPLYEAVGPYINPGQLFEEGQDVAKLVGVTHYVPEFDQEETKSDSAAAPRRRYPKTLRGWFFFILRTLGIRNAGGKSYAQEVSFNLPIYDVNALKQSRVKFNEGELVLVTEKIHGSNARYTVQDGVFYAGSHEQWKQQGPNVWWNAVKQHPEIEEFCHQNPGLVLYGEVGPTQKGFRYGCGDGETFFFAFGAYDPKTCEYYWPGNLGFALNVPVLYAGAFSAEKVLPLVDGPSTVPSAGHIREGVVVHSRDRQLKLKIVSNDYLTMKG
jgi:hypothetical protein